MEPGFVEGKAGPGLVSDGAHVDEILSDAPKGEFSEGGDVLAVDADGEEEDGERGDVEGYLGGFLEVGGHEAGEGGGVREGGAGSFPSRSLHLMRFGAVWLDDLRGIKRGRGRGRA